MKIPPFLLGATLLFWGRQTEFFFVSSVIALIIESARFLPWRWSLSEQDFNRILDLNFLLLLPILIHTFMSYDLTVATLLLFQWLPLLLLPLVVSQIYSTENRIRLSRVLFLWRKAEAISSAQSIDILYPYFMLCLLAASAANVRTVLFYIGLFLLAAWTLWYVRPKRFSFFLWAGLLVSAGLMGYAGQIGLNSLQGFLEIKFLEWFSNLPVEDPYYSHTAIGDVENLKQSDRILFRVKTEGTSTKPPFLLRGAGYNLFGPSAWLAWKADFSSVQPESDGTTWKLREGPIPKNSMTISAYLKRGKGLLILPNGAVQIEGLPVLKMERNRFGAVKVEEGAGLITYRVRFDPGASGEAPPEESDLDVTPRELQAVSKIVTELGLDALPPREVLRSVAAFFQNHFKYALSQPAVRYKWNTASTPLGRFLLDTRSGHCEYFATATVLILRQAGIPARYATGYLAQEFSPLESAFVIRSRHAHAWALAYIDGAWRDFDTTPASWFAIEQESVSFYEPIVDLWSRCTYLFYRWLWDENKTDVGRYSNWLWGVLIFALTWKILRNKRFIRFRKKSEPEHQIFSRPGSDSEFYLILQKLETLGLNRYPWEPLSDWVERVGSVSPPSVSADELRSVLALHYRYRYDPNGIGEEERLKLRSHAYACLERIERKPTSKHRI